MTAPAYMTCTLSATSATTPRSWVMRITAVPNSCCRRLDDRQDLGLHGDVERGGRLVGDQQLGVERHGHRDHGPLPHAAGELVRVVVHPAVRLRDADQLEQLDRPGPGLLLGHGLVVLRGSSPRSASRPGSTGAGWTAGPGRSCAISAPRTFRISTGPRVSRSRPSNIAWPVIRAPRVRPMIVCVETLLPEPDSPTMPRVCPASTWKETPRTACTTPSDGLEGHVQVVNLEQGHVSYPSPT